MLIPVPYLIIGFLVLVTLLFSIFLRPKLSVFSQIIVYVLLLFIAISYGLHATRDTFSGPLRQFLDFQHGEFNHTATMSSLLLFSAGAMAFIQAFSRKKAWWNFPLWVYVASLFWFLATDEYFLIHETLAYWEEIYISVAGVTTLILLTVVWFRYTRLQFIALFITVCGLGVSAVGGIVLENVVGDLCFGLVPRSYCASLPILEEIFEITGYATAFIGLLLFVEQTYEKVRIRRVRVALTSMAFIWLSWLIFSYWFLPALELRFMAEPVNARFDDGRMIVRGYRIIPDRAMAGDTIRVRLYWYSEKAPINQFGYTVNIVHPNTGESIVRLNEIFDAPPTDDWFANTVHWTDVAVELPSEIETPISPLIIPTVWRETSDGVYFTYTAEESNVPVLNSGPVMTAIPILSTTENSVDDADYNFANGIVLSVVEAEDAYSFDFQWMSSADISAELAQILHLVPEGEGDILIFDQTPFEGVFPTTTWVAGMSEVDTVTLEIPADAPSGQYTLYTGLYDVLTGERVPITSDGAENGLMAVAEVAIGTDE